MLLALLLLGVLAGAAAPGPPPPGPLAAGGRVLACYWGEEVATELTFATFQKFVLNPLGAELCGCVSAAANASGPATLWRQAALYLDVYQPLSSYEHLVSLQADRAGRNSSSAWSAAFRRCATMRPTGGASASLVATLPVWHE